MGANRRTAVIIGVCFLLGYVGIFLGSALYAPVLDDSDYLARIYPEKSTVIAGMLTELVNDVAVIGIAIFLYPILRRYSESMALAFFAFRFMEAVLLIVSKVSVLSLTSVSQHYIAAGASGASPFPALGAAALAAREASSQLSTVFFCLGALVFYCMMYQTKLMPRPISVYGLIALASLVLANVLGVPDPTQGFQPAAILYLLMFVSELLVAVWLIVKGFNPSAVASASAEQG
jgi:hypothetical protein